MRLSIGEFGQDDKPFNNNDRVVKINNIYEPYQLPVIMKNQVENLTLV